MEKLIRYSARNPAPCSVCVKKDSMLIPEIDWKWDDSIKELVPYEKPEKVDLQALTDSYADSVGIKNILAQVAQGDFTHIRPNVQYGDVSEAPENIHELRQMAENAKSTAKTLTDLGLVDKDGKPLTGEALTELETEDLKAIVSAYVQAKQAAKEGGTNNAD